MRSLSDRERKLVAVLILVGIIALGYLLLVEPVVAGFAERAAQRETLARQFAANQRIVAAIPRLLRQAQQQRDALRGLVVEASGVADGSVLVQERLQRDIEAVGGELREVGDASADDGLVRVKLVARLTLDQLVRLLARLDNQTPHVTTEALTLSADRALISGHLEPMDVTVEVSIPLARPAARRP